MESDMSNATCSADDCTVPVGPHGAKGMCPRHYKRSRAGVVPRKSRATLGPRKPRKRTDPVELFWRKVDKVGPAPTYRPDLGPCWLWTAYITPSTGYGWFGYTGTGLNEQIRTTGHRFSYETFVGEVPQGWHVDHLCRVRECVNPAHLEAVPHGENIRRGFEAKGRVTHCKRGHEYSPENTLWTGGQIVCRICSRIRSAEFRARRRASRAS